MPKQHKVVYIGPFSFPNGGAAARRILGNARSMRNEGYEVIIGAGQLPDSPDRTQFQYDGFTVHSLGERTAEKLSTPLKYAAYATMGRKSVSWLDSLSRKPDALILYSGYLPYFRRLLPWCSENKIPLIFDAVEWYTPHKWFEWLYSPYFWSSEFSMRWLVPAAGNVIAISSYLQEEYERKGCHVVRIPPLIQVEEFYNDEGHSTESKLRLVYAGSPGSKDLLNTVIDSVLNIDPDGERIVLTILGPDKNEVSAYEALKSRSGRQLPACLEPVGKVSHEQAVKAVREADFSVLIRRSNRVSNAGFPTKVVESLMVGTPVIANLTSDLRSHLADGVNALLVPGCSKEALVPQINRALKLSVTQKREMRSRAYLHATRAFDMCAYGATLAGLIEVAIAKAQ